jgi:hypothetical protein
VAEPGIKGFPGDKPFGVPSVYWETLRVGAAITFPLSISPVLHTRRLKRKYLIAVLDISLLLIAKVTASTHPAPEVAPGFVDTRVLMPCSA